MHQSGGSQFRVPPPVSPDMSPFSTHGTQLLGIPAVESLRHVDPQIHQLHEIESPMGGQSGPQVTTTRPHTADFDELTPAVAGNFPEDDGLVASGNRWPRQETLALLKIRLEMDAAFKDATLKGPLWDEVSRKLAELGYKRNAKKCKEKFENVHKYYKRTKDGRAGRQDGKSYRFFSQLEALHSSPGTTMEMNNSVSTVSPLPINFSTAAMQSSQLSSVVAPSLSNPAGIPAPIVPELTPQSVSGLQAMAAAAAGIGFSSDSSSESDDEDTDEGVQIRKRGSEGLIGSGRSSKRMMAFFDGLMKQVIEKQESIQKQFLEAIEKREQERMIREEAWRRQEMARLSREQELLAHERAVAASRDAALISYLQKVSNETQIKFPLMANAAVASGVTTAAESPQTPTPQKNQKIMHDVIPLAPPAAAAAIEATAVLEPQETAGGMSFDSISASRWPKAEVHALIDLRSSLDSRYQDNGPKGPLWEEISAEMQKLGYNRNAKRCKEKWENINKYFKKVKERNKKRPNDAKTCPYFHQLDALYRQKQIGNSGGGGGSEALAFRMQTEQETHPNSNATAQTQVLEIDGKNLNNGGIETSFEEGIKKPEDIVKELMEERQQQSVVIDYQKVDEGESDNIEQDYSDYDDDDDEDDENGRMQYKIQYQRPNVSNNGGGSDSAPPTANAGSFLAIVQ